jgi:hypothetical protein
MTIERFLKYTLQCPLTLFSQAVARLDENVLIAKRGCGNKGYPLHNDDAYPFHILSVVSHMKNATTAAGNIRATAEALAVSFGAL